MGRLFAFVAKAEVLRGKAAGPLLGLGVDESAALAVEPDGTARIYATAPDGGAWLVKGGFPETQMAGKPLSLARVNVTGIGHGSVLHLPDGRVDNPVFEKQFSIAGGQMVEAKPEQAQSDAALH